MAGSVYALVKGIHVGCAALSVAGLLARGVLVLARSPWPATRFARIAPHGVDSLLLASAIWLAALTGQYPFVHAWLTAKVLALVVYIVLGGVALGRARPAPVRAAALAGALATAGYIVSVAVTRDPRGALAWLLPA